MEVIKIASTTGGKTLWDVVKAWCGITNIGEQLAAKANASQPSFTVLQPLLNDTSSGAGLTNYPPGFMRDSLGFVHLRGVISNTTPILTEAALLPPGSRPGKNLFFEHNTNGYPVRISVLSSGKIYVETLEVGSNAYLYRLENCPSFRADA